MNAVNFSDLKANLSELRPVHPVGRIEAISAGVIIVSGLKDHACIGDCVRLLSRGQTERSGEIVQIRRDGTSVVLPDDRLEGLAAGCRVVLTKKPSIAPHQSWIGRMIDANGRAIDGMPLFQGAIRRDLQAPAPLAAKRQPLGTRLNTGLAAFDTLLPLVEGQRMGIFAGSGVGKSSLLADFARGVSADVVVIALVGERGREVRHFVEETLGAPGMKRAVVVAATSDQSPLMRRRCAWTAMALAEHFRDLGQSVLFLADSVTRFAEAHREIATAAGEAPVLRGFPASTTPLITGLCERAGPGVAGSGHITGIFSVLVAGSDMDEPISDILRGVLDGHVVLDRSIAERGRFPAVELLRSISRSLPAAATPEENGLIAEVRKALGIYAKNEMMLSAGLYTYGSDPSIDHAAKLWPEIEDFLAKRHDQDVMYSFAQLKLALRRANNSNGVGGG